MVKYCNVTDRKFDSRWVCVGFQGRRVYVDTVRDLAARAEELLGDIDVLVNNAGITTNLPFHDVTVEQFDTLYNVNIRSMYFLTPSVIRCALTRSLMPEPF